MHTIKNNFYLRKILFTIANNQKVSNNDIYNNIYRKFINNQISGELQKPVIVQVETSTYCNADCIMCSLKLMSRPKGIMDYKIYCKIIDECAEWRIPQISICGFGEPLLDNHLIDRIKYAKNRGIKFIRTFTNGILLKEELAYKLLTSGLDELLISIESGDKQEYESIRLNLNFDILKQNIENIMTQKKKLRLTKPKVGITGLLINNNFSSLKKIYQIFSKKVDFITFHNANNWGGTVNINTNSKNILACSNLWYHMFINWDGNVALCCVDFDRKINLGSIINNSLKDIWNSKKFNDIRFINSFKKEAIQICKKCNVSPNWWNWWISNLLQ